MAYPDIEKSNIDYENQIDEQIPIEDADKNLEKPFNKKFCAKVFGLVFLGLSYVFIFSCCTSKKFVFNCSCSI